MKKQKKKNKKLKVGTFRELTRTRSCIGTITRCQAIRNKKKTELELTIRVMPEDVRFYETKHFPVDDISHLDHLQDVFRVTLEKKYSPNEEILIGVYLTGMLCALQPDYCDVDYSVLCTSITPQISPACIVDMFCCGELTGYELSHKKKVLSRSKKKKI